jgi:predicted urease superfamily metal-dependent hydrolase
LEEDMLILQLAGWFVLSCVLMSFIEHQVHARLMHRRNYFSDRSAKYKRVFEAHAMVHHKHYSKLRIDTLCLEGIYPQKVMRFSQLIFGPKNAPQAEQNIVSFGLN